MGTTFRLSVGTITAALFIAAAATMSAQATATKTVTFSKDVAPIFQAKCQSCHEPGSIAPMSLRSYAEVRPWVSSIRARVSTRQMPPWHIDRGIGVQKFKNDMSLTDEEIETIVNWVDSGARPGNPADMPPLKLVETSLYWQAERDGYGPPDIVVKSGEQTMPVVHQDEWWRPVVDIPGLAEPRWVRMVEIRPSNLPGREILHHSIAYLILNNDPEAVNHGTSSGLGRARIDTVDLVN
jgi:mono/diheme cytochrome c family protein